MTEQKNNATEDKQDSLKKSATPLSNEELDTAVGGMRSIRRQDIDGPEVVND